MHLSRSFLYTHTQREMHVLHKCCKEKIAAFTSPWPDPVRQKKWDMNGEQEINYGEGNTPGVKCNSGDFKTKKIG